MKKTLIALLAMTAVGTISFADEPAQANKSITNALNAVAKIPTTEELNKIQAERTSLLKAQEELRRKEAEMAQRLAVLKEQQRKETKELLVKKAEVFRNEKIKEYERNINEMKAQIEQNRKEVADREKQLNTRIEESTLLYENQMNEIEATNKQIEESEKKLQMLKEKQQQRLAALQDNHKKEIGNLKQQQTQLAIDIKTKTAKEVAELERQMRISSAKITNLSKTETNQIIRENMSVLGDGLDLDGLNFDDPKEQPTQPQGSTKDAKPQVEEGVNESDSLQINQNRNEFEKNPIITEWVQAKIKKHNGEYKSQGTWLDTKSSNKI